MNRRIRHALAAVIAGLTTIAGATVFNAPLAHAATPYFTGTSSCDVVTGYEVIAYTVPNPLNTYTTSDITAVNAVYTKTGAATVFTSVPQATYPTDLAGGTLTMTVPGNLPGTYRVNITVTIATPTGTDWIAVVADATVAGTCIVAPGEVLPTTITVSPSPTTAPATTAATTTAPATTAAVPTSAAPTATLPGTGGPTSVAVTSSVLPTAAGTDASSAGSSTTAGAVAGTSFAATGAGVDEPMAILGIASLVVGGALVLCRKRA